MRGARAGLAVAMTLASVGVARAVCPGLDVLFEDKFDNMKPTWGEASEAIRVEGGQLVISPASGTYAWAANTAGIYDDVDMCVTVNTVTAADPLDAFAGLVFWYEDVNNFYAFEIAPNGKASVWRRERGRWLAQVEWGVAGGANTGDGAVNELRVTTDGDGASFSVNGTPFTTLSGSPPEQGQQIGVLAASPEEGAALFAFDDLKVTKP